ncbi:MAG: CAP domain-containing protein, partial [Oscillospiraceae bacterium]|nr:CAP domain-containing protein [Oscillospiraceae bacterium]
MKKIVSLLLALLLCMGVTALADGAPAPLETTESQAPLSMEETASVGEAAVYSEEEIASEETASEEDDGCYDTVIVSGVYEQTEARSLLALINQLRAGEDAWVWDEENEEQTYLTELEDLSYDYALEQIAMTRAAELALSFSHTRPDGSEWYALVSAETESWGENIAYGYGTAEEVFAAWLEADEDYAGQGHRRNMLSQDYTAVGIACFCVDGVYYWVQVFGDASDAQETQPQDGEAQVEVTVLYESHDYEAEITEPTCTKEGYTTYTCTRCGKTYTDDYTDALGHDYVGAVTAPTCTEGGYTTYTCSRCGDTYTTEYTDPVEHNYVAAVTAPTCTENGYTTYTCSYCGDTYIADETEATGHSYESVVTEPTCTEKGY